MRSYKIFFLTVWTALFGGELLAGDLQLQDSCIKVKATVISMFRASNLTPLPAARVFRIGHEIYTSTERLGKSSAEVLLARDLDDRPFVIKVMDPAERTADMLLYELYVSRYFRERDGVADDFPYVPEVFAVDRNQGLLLKEYVEGVTLKEIERDPALLPSELYAQLPEIKRRLELIIGQRQRGFRAWLLERGIPFESWPIGLQNLIGTGDFKPANILWSPVHGWTLIDP